VVGGTPGTAVVGGGTGPELLLFITFFSRPTTMAEGGNGFLGMGLLAPSMLDRGETACAGFGGATNASSSGVLR
jgi:hypothetical protein